MELGIKAGPDPDPSEHFFQTDGSLTHSCSLGSLRSAGEASFLFIFLADYSKISHDNKGSASAETSS